MKKTMETMTGNKAVCNLLDPCPRGLRGPSATASQASVECAGCEHLRFEDSGADVDENWND